MFQTFDNENKTKEVFTIKNKKIKITRTKGGYNKIIYYFLFYKMQKGHNECRVKRVMRSKERRKGERRKR